MPHKISQRQYALSLKAPSLRSTRVWGLGKCGKRSAINACMKKEGRLFLGDQLLVRTQRGLLPRVGELVGWKPALFDGYFLVTIEAVDASAVDPLLVIHQGRGAGSMKEPPMTHKISQHQYNILPPGGLTPFLPQARRLLAGEGTNADLAEIVNLCKKHGRHALARELLDPPPSTRVLI